SEADGGAGGEWEVKDGAGDDQWACAAGNRTESRQAKPLGKAGTQRASGGAVSGCGDEEVCCCGGGWGGAGVREVAVAGFLVAGLWRRPNSLIPMSRNGSRPVVPTLRKRRSVGQPVFRHCASQLGSFPSCRTERDKDGATRQI